MTSTTEGRENPSVNYCVSMPYSFRVFKDKTLVVENKITDEKFIFKLTKGDKR